MFELAALGRPAVYIPLTKRASRGDQILNAESFAGRGYAVVLDEQDLTIDNLMQKLDEAEKLDPKPLPPADVEQIADIISSCARAPRA